MKRIVDSTANARVLLSKLELGRGGGGGGGGDGGGGGLAGGCESVDLSVHSSCDVVMQLDAPALRALEQWPANYSQTTVATPTQMRCGYCDFVTKYRPDTMFWHLMRHRGVRDLKCNDCERMFYSRKFVWSHLVKKHKRKMTDEECAEYKQVHARFRIAPVTARSEFYILEETTLEGGHFPVRNNQEGGGTTTAGDPPAPESDNADAHDLVRSQVPDVCFSVQLGWTCLGCCRDFTDPQAFLDHVEDRHGKACPTLYRCDYCEYLSPDPIVGHVLDRHAKRSILPQGKLQCPRCWATQTSLKAFQNHLRFCHSTLEEEAQWKAWEMDPLIVAVSIKEVRLGGSDGSSGELQQHISRLNHPESVHNDEALRRTLPSDGYTEGGLGTTSDASLIGISFGQELDMCDVGAWPSEAPGTALSACTGKSDTFRCDDPPGCHVMRFMYCDMCERFISSRNMFIAHMKRRHIACPYECLRCARKFHSKRIFLTHPCEEQLKPVVGFPCRICCHVSRSRAFLMLHVLRIHPVMTDRGRCKLCGHVFPTPATLLCHMSCHGNKLACKLGGYRLTSAPRLQVRSFGRRKNIIIPGRLPAPRLITESIEKCRAIFNLAHTLMKRAPAHECHICGRVFRSAARLEGHVNLHNKRDSRLARETSLSRRADRGANHAGCSTCGRMFSRSQQLTAHMRKCHRGVRGQAANWKVESEQSPRPPPPPPPPPPPSTTSNSSSGETVIYAEPELLSLSLSPSLAEDLVNV